jgi:hypothetical protein
MKWSVWNLVFYSKVDTPIENIKKDVFWKLFVHKRYELTEEC